MPALFGKSSLVRRTPGDAMRDFEIALDKLITDGRRAYVDPRLLARRLNACADALQQQRAVTAPVV